jgi:hypothetical protein
VVRALSERGDAAVERSAALPGSTRTAPGPGAAATSEAGLAPSEATASLVERAGGSAGVELVASAMPPAVLAVSAMAATALAMVKVEAARTGTRRGSSWGSGDERDAERNAARAADSPRSSAAVVGADAAARIWGSGDGPSPPSSSRRVAAPESRPGRRERIA